jgi:phosphatidylinositol alpha 1,6-mannosyltransferase
MRIAIYSEIYWPMVSGVALTLRRLVDALHARGHSVRVYTAQYELPPGAVPRPEVHASPSRPFFLAPDVHWAFPRTADLIADMREFQPQVVHLATEFAMGYPGLKASRALGLPIIASSHTDYEAYARPYGRWLVTAVQPGWTYLRWFYKHAHKVLCPTRVYEARLHARGVMHTGIWTRGVNAEEFNPRFRSDAWRAKFGVGPQDTLVTFVGRIAPEKNLELLLEAWQRLAPVRGNAQLTLIGDGLLVDGIRKRNIPGLHLLGHLHGIELATSYASADVFAFPSSTETFGNVMLEAMASGTAPVCVNVGGPTEYAIDERNALIAGANDLESFTAKLGRLITDAGLRRHISEGARQTALGRRWDAIYDQLLDDYAETIADRRQALAVA